jgi:membrane protein DedA with SNARE-associated domain
VEARILAWLGHYGAPVLFLAQLFGIFGLPIPDELLLTTAGVLVRNGGLTLGPTLAAAICGSSAGITVSYVLGRTVGAAALQRVLHVDRRSLARGQEWFERLGGWLLMFGYFIPGVRHVTAIAAGSMPLDYSCFARYAYPGAALWSSFFLGVGYYSGNRWAELLAVVRANVTAIFLAVAAILLAYIVLSWRRIHPD